MNDQWFRPGIKEHWLHVEEFPRYLVSQYGNVYDCVRERMLAQSVTKKGYYIVNISTPYGRFTVSVHRLVAKTFYDVDSENDKEVNHRDGDKSNNCIWNLEWMTHVENMRHAYAMGLLHRPAINDIPIKCVETGQEFRSMGDAAKYLGTYSSEIWRVVDKPQWKCRGYHFVTISEGGEANDDH